MLLNLLGIACVSFPLYPTERGVLVISWARYLYCDCLAQEGESLVYLTKHLNINPLYQWFSYLFVLLLHNSNFATKR